MTSWFYLKNGKVTGPVKLEDIHKLVESKKIGGFDLIYRSDEKKWKPVVEFEEMKPLFDSEAEMVNPDDEVTGSHDISHLVIPRSPKKETQWVVLRILDRQARPVKTEQLGPFTTAVVQKMIRQGDLSFQDYVWTDAMEQWGLLVEQEELVPKIELPKLVETLTVEDTVREPEESGEELFQAVETTQPGAPPIPEDPPEEAGTKDLVTEVTEITEMTEVTEISKQTTQEGAEKQSEPAPDRTSEFRIISLEEEKEKEKPQPKKAGERKAKEEGPSSLPKSKKSERKKRSSKDKGARTDSRKKSSSKKTKSRPRVPKDSPYKEKSEEDWSFRLLQGLFGAFVIGGIVGIAFFLSHESLDRDELQFEPEVVEQAPPAQPRPQPVVEKPKPLPSQKKPEPEKKTPPPVVKKAPSYVKLALKGISGKRPKVEVKTDASHHYPADFLLTAAAGQILTHPSYHREWTVKKFENRFRTIDFRSLGLRDGWYTLLVSVGSKRTLKTFFIGKKKTYNSRVRKYRKTLGYQHQAEKEQLYFVIRDVVDALQALRKAKSSTWRKSRAKAETALRMAQRAVSGRLKNKNSHLWTVYWIQLRERGNDLEESLKKLKKNSSRGIRSHEKAFEKLLGRVQGLRVVN